ncbi:hypothetical protein ANN_23931 [Periplaneta americana]|uniref:Uncharacterized protein n=1 Tax=Periplaneta americana TaxID=6978 RepID=A0ABQ8S1Y7_PERAM|nr:hypothetical protein ANN_23931 [Periplaneta americana]
MAGSCEGDNEPPGSLKATTLATAEVISTSPDVPEFCPAGVLLHASKSTDMSLMAFSGAETWILRRSEEKRLEAFEMWIWRRMERVKCTDRIGNEAVAYKEEWVKKLKLMRKIKRDWLGHWLRRNCLLKNAVEEIVNGRRVRSRRRYQMIDNIKIYGSYEEIIGRRERGKLGECCVYNEGPAFGRNTMNENE